MDKVIKTEEEWKQELSPKQYHVLRQKGTEAPFSGEYVHLSREGMYHCAACGAELFPSDTKFHSDTGWPSFTDPVDRRNVILSDDFTEWVHRIEVTCARCGSHLGHVFDDGPSERGGKRYCINSCALKFNEK